MTYNVVQPQKTKNGMRYYLYEVTAEWDPEKKRSRQKRRYLGPCDEEGNLIKEPVKKQAIVRSPSYGPYYILDHIAKESGLDRTLYSIYGEKEGKKLLALAILGVTDPCSIDLAEETVDDTYLRELMDLEWTFEQSEVCRFLQRMGEDAGSREELFSELSPKEGCVIFDIVCLGTDSEGLEYSEAGRKTRLTGSKQFNLGMVHSMEDGLPFCYRTYPGSIADVVTLDVIVRDLQRMGCGPFEMVMDRGFFSAGNIGLMIERSSCFTVPIPARNKIQKLLISDSVKEIESPLNTDYLDDSSVRGYETRVVLDEGEFVMDANGTIRAVVFQDDARRQMEVSTLYRRLNEMESFLGENDFDPILPKKMSPKQLEIFNLLEVTDDGGRNSIQRKRNAIAAKENACGRFAVLTTSTLPWKDLLIEYRMRNEVEYDFSQLQSDLFVGIKGKSVQKSAEGGLLVNFLSLRLRLMLLGKMKESKLTDEMWIPKLMRIMRKLRITKVGDEWRLNEVTKKQREILSKLGIPLL